MPDQLADSQLPPPLWVPRRKQHGAGGGDRATPASGCLPAAEPPSGHVAAERRPPEASLVTEPEPIADPWSVLGR